MLKNLKNKKKKGFTLIELVVVIAIIAILAAVLIPQISGYISDSKETAAIAQCKEIVTAVESANANREVVQSTDELADIIAVPEVAEKLGGSVTVADFDRLATDLTYAEMRLALKSDKNTLTMTGDVLTEVVAGITTP